MNRELKHKKGSPIHIFLKNLPSIELWFSCWRMNPLALGDLVTKRHNFHNSILREIHQAHTYLERVGFNDYSNAVNNTKTNPEENRYQMKIYVDIICSLNEPINVK